MSNSINRACVLTMAAVLIICCMFAVPIFADYQELLSEMPDEQLMAEMKLLGVECPETILDNHPEERVDLIRFFVKEIEKDPCFEAGANRRDVTMLFQMVKVAVLIYYGWPESSITKVETELERNGLTDSTYYSYGDGSKNCYGYAIDRNVYVSPGYYAYGVENIPDSQLSGMTVYQLAERAKADLQTTDSKGLNQQCVIITNARPSYQNGITAICVRKGKWDTANLYDFHFMRVFPSSVWRHKPANTCVLTYNSLPSNNVNWTNERAKDSTHFLSPFITYSGTIYYLTFKGSHNFINSYTGENYHSGSKHYYRFADTCSRCGYTTNYTWQSIPCSGPPCPDYHPNKTGEASIE